MKITSAKYSSFCTWQTERSRLWSEHRGVISEWDSPESSAGRWELRHKSLGLSGSLCGVESAGTATPLSLTRVGLLPFTSLSVNCTSKEPFAVVRLWESWDVSEGEGTASSEVSRRLSHSKLSTVLVEETRELEIRSLASKDELGLLAFLLNLWGVGSDFPICLKEKMHKCICHKAQWITVRRRNNNHCKGLQYDHHSSIICITVIV